MNGDVVLEILLAHGVTPFTLRGLDRTAWNNLVNEHPSGDPRWKYDADSLNPHLVSQCVVHPTIGPDFAAQLIDDTDIGVELVDTCLRLSQPGDWEWARRRLDTDARLMAEVAAAARMGIPHDQFTGWPVRSQDLALAYFESLVRVCPGCGVPEKDMSDPRAWEPDRAACVHCEVLERTREQIPEEARHRVHVHLVRPQVT